MNVPVEIFSYICDIIPTKDLCSTMLVSRLCCDVAERLLYSSIHLDFFDTRQRPRSTMCLQTLSTSASAAAAVRHLEIRGLGLLDAPAHTTFIAAMMLATNVSSLDIMLIIPSQSPVFPASLVTSSSFLPHLVALNVDDSNIIPQLVPGRPCASVRIQDTIPEDCLNDVVDALARAAVPIEHLQLKLAIPGEHAILPSFIPIAHSFRSLISLGIQFVLPSPSLTWESLEVSTQHVHTQRPYSRKLPGVPSHNGSPTFTHHVSQGSQPGNNTRPWDALE